MKIGDVVKFRESSIYVQCHFKLIGVSHEIHPTLGEGAYLAKVVDKPAFPSYDLGRIATIYYKELSQLELISKSGNYNRINKVTWRRR